MELAARIEIRQFNPLCQPAALAVKKASTGASSNIIKHPWVVLGHDPDRALGAATAQQPARQIQRRATKALAPHRAICENKSRCGK